MGRPLLAAPPTRWRHYSLATAEASYDPHSILVSSSDVEAGAQATITTAGVDAGSGVGVLNELSMMASWVWPMSYHSGGQVDSGDGPVTLLGMMHALSQALQSESVVLAGFIDGPDPTAEGLNGVGWGLGTPGGGNARTPWTWAYQSGSMLSDVDASAGTDSVRCIWDASRRLTQWRELTTSGLQSDGTTSAGGDRSFLIGSNIDMSAVSAVNPMRAVLAYGSSSGVTALSVTALASYLAHRAPPQGYTPSL